MKHFSVMVAVVNLLAIAAAGCSSSDPSPVNKAKSLIAAEEKRIWRLAHITVPKYAKCECETGITDSGVRLSYTYTWTVKEKGKEVEQTTKVAFNFNAKGTLDGIPIGDVIEVGADTSKTEPFKASGVAVAVLRDYLSKKVSSLPDPLRVEIEREMSEKITPVRFLAMWLKFREYVAAPDEKDDK